MSDVQTRNNADLQRWEATVGGELAGFADYTSDDGTVVFTHTEVDDAFEGQGVASALARAGLDDVRSSGGRVVAQCAFIKGWIDKHPDYQDLLA